MTPDRSRHYLENGTSKDTDSASVPSEQSDRPPIDVSDEKSSPLAYSIQHSQSGYENEWRHVELFQAGLEHTIDKPYRNKSTTSYKSECLPVIPWVIVSRPVNKLFTNADNYQNYRLIKT